VGSADGYLYAVNPNGTLKWKYQTGFWLYAGDCSSPALAPDGTVYVGSNNTYLYAISPKGTLTWRFATDYGIGSSPTVASDGTIYLELSDNYLCALSASGTLKWKAGTGSGIGSGTRSSPAIASDGTIYVGSDDNYLYAINPNGAFKWKTATGKSFDSGTKSSPAIAANGTVYVGSSDNCLYAINPDGTIRWKAATGNPIESSPAISSDGTVYVGSEDGCLYALGGATPISYYLATVSSPQDAGWIVRSPAGPSYLAGSVVSVTAYASDGYRFERWTGDASGTSATTTVTMTANKTVTAVFSPTSYTLTTSPSPSNGGTILRSPSGASYAPGTVVTLTAVPNAPFHLDRWSGGGTSGTSLTATVTMTGNEAVTATFDMFSPDEDGYAFKNPSLNITDDMLMRWANVGPYGDPLAADKMANVMKVLRSWRDASLGGSCYGMTVTAMEDFFKNGPQPAPAP
jgi:uncharacterized repeat protein (TIGR02543 family)